MIRSLRRTLRWLADPYAVLDAESKRQGLTFWMDLAPSTRVLVTGDPALVRQIIGHPDLDAGQGISALRQILGDRSLITLDGEDHLARRRIVAPLFRDLDRFDGLTVEAAREAAGELRPGDPFSVYDLTRRISLRVIVRLLFGEAGTARIEKLVDAFLLSFESPWVLFLKPLHVNLGSLTPWGRALGNRAALQAELLERIQVYRRSGGEGGLAHIVREGAELSDGEIVAEVLALLLFGHDTGAATLAWAFAHLYRHPEAVSRVHEEAREEAGTAYLDACLKESMRLAPVVVHVTRIARRDLRIGGYEVPAGTRIFPSAYLAQRNPAVFPEPERFRPERFLEGKSYEGSYFPFGFSPRTCVGKHFVTRQMILITSTLIRHLDLAPAPGYVAKPARRLVLVLPREGTRMVSLGRRQAA